jgi:4-amino-4-deoxy-L-arabinose transferase-like glycosyltransferase
MFLVPQSILFFFWALSFYLFIKLIKSNDHKYWYLLGGSIGLGILSDFAMIMFIPAVIIYLIMKPEKRFWLRTPHLYAALIPMILIITPMLYWEKIYNFPSFSYHKERTNSPNINNLIYFAVLQIIFYTPFIFTDVIKTIINAVKLRKNILSAIVSGVIFIPFLILGIFMPVGGHWTATAYLPSFFKSSYKKAFLLTTLIFAVIINGLAIYYFLFLYPVPKSIQGREYTVNAALKEYCFEKQNKNQTYFFSNNLGVAGLVAFYGNVPAFMPKGRHLQYDLWGQPELKPGDDLVYFALSDTEISGKLKPMFKQVMIDPEVRIFTKDADIPVKTQVIVCKNYIKGIIP